MFVCCCLGFITNRHQCELYGHPEAPGHLQSHLRGALWRTQVFRDGRTSGQVRSLLQENDVSVVWPVVSCITHTHTHTHSLIVLDEIDQLVQRGQEVLYTLFEWPSLPGSKVVLVGMSQLLAFVCHIRAHPNY